MRSQLRSQHPERQTLIQKGNKEWVQAVRVSSSSTDRNRKHSMVEYPCCINKWIHSMAIIDGSAFQSTDRSYIWKAWRETSLDQYQKRVQIKASESSMQ